VLSFFREHGISQSVYLWLFGLWALICYGSCGSVFHTKCEKLLRSRSVAEGRPSGVAVATRAERDSAGIPLGGIGGMLVGEMQVTRTVGDTVITTTRMDFPVSSMGFYVSICVWNENERDSQGIIVVSYSAYTSSMSVSLLKNETLQYAADAPRNWIML